MYILLLFSVSCFVQKMLYIMSDSPHEKEAFYFLKVVLESKFLSATRFFFLIAMNYIVWINLFVFVVIFGKF